MILKLNGDNNAGPIDWHGTTSSGHFNRRRWNIILVPATKFSIGGVDGLETNTVSSPNNFQVTASCDADVIGDVTLVDTLTSSALADIRNYEEDRHKDLIIPNVDYTTC
jgi:hypothetical protein